MSPCTVFSASKAAANSVSSGTATALNGSAGSEGTAVGTLAEDVRLSPTAAVTSSHWHSRHRSVPMAWQHRWWEVTFKELQQKGCVITAVSLPTALTAAVHGLRGQCLPYFLPCLSILVLSMTWALLLLPFRIVLQGFKLCCLHPGPLLPEPCYSLRALHWEFVEFGKFLIRMDSIPSSLGDFPPFLSPSMHFDEVHRAPTAHHLNS